MTAPFFLVMEYLAGESLRQRMRRDFTLPISAALWIARQTAEALAALHHAGFIHGDVKPENIRLVDAGAATLLDLGFAHRPGENASLLDDGYILGTVNYLAPELCGPDLNDDPRADIFSLGVTLFELLTGQLPYPTGTPLETMHAHRTTEPRLLTDCLPAAPASLTELVDQMLARDPSDRPRASQLVHELIGREIASLSHPLAA
jgi:serine/threonine protein kinase